VLPHLDNLSKSFQHSTINFSHLKSEVVRAKAALDEVATREAPVKEFSRNVKEGKMAMLQFSPSEHQLAYMRNLLLKYVSALKENIDLRFQNTLLFLGALSIFYPTLTPSSVSELPSYGVDSIKVLAKHYFPDQQDRLLAEWNALKYHMKDKTRLRSRLSNDMLACLLNIPIKGPEVNSHECDTLVKMTTEKWLSCRRYKLSKGKSAARKALGTSEKEPTLIETTNASTQTEAT